MPNPKLETYKNKATGTVYDYTDAAAQASIAAIEEKIPDVASSENQLVTEAGLNNVLNFKEDKVPGKGLSTNDYDDTEKAKVAGAFPRSEQAVLGARNFDPINNLKTVTTQEGVKYTPVYDSDGSLQYITINRESAGTQQAYPDFTLNLRLKAGRYKLACPMEGGEWGLDKMRYYLRYGSTYVTKDSDDDPVFTLAEDTTINFTSVRVEAGYSPSNVKVYPMILLADDSYTGYSPYAMTNKELTEKVTPKPLAFTPIEGVTVARNTSVKLQKIAIINMSITIASDVTSMLLGSFDIAPAEIQYLPSPSVYASTPMNVAMRISKADGNLQCYTNTGTGVKAGEYWINGVVSI